MVKLKTAAKWTTVNCGMPAKYVYTGLLKHKIYQFKVEHWHPDGTVTISNIEDLPIL